MKVKLKRINKEAILPKYATKGSACADLFCCEKVIVKGGETKLVSIGWAMEIPEGFEVQIRPRSGISYKTTVVIPNSPATIDSDFRGEIMVILRNMGSNPHVFDKGFRIAQMALVPVTIAEFEEVDELDDTERGEGGFGSTGNG